MIITTQIKIKDALTKNAIIVVDDVNSSNKDEVFSIIDKCDLYIDNKFPSPMSSNEIIGERSHVISEVNRLITCLGDDINSGAQNVALNDTQLKNIKVKMLFWCSGIFSDVLKKLDNKQDVTIVINNELSKHERMFVKVLANCGASILLLNSKANEQCETEKLGSYENGIKCSVQSLEFNTNEKLEYNKKEAAHAENTGNSSEIVTRESIYKSLDEVEHALYTDGKIVKVNVVGMNNYIDTCNFYGKLNRNCMNNSDWVLANRKFPVPSYEQTSVIPRVPNTKHDYLVHTISQFIKIADNNSSDSVKDAIISVMNTQKYKQLDGQILYNKLVYVVCSLNSIYSNGKPKCIVYYGNVNSNDEITLEVLAQINDISVIIACSDKDLATDIMGIDKLELNISNEIFTMPIVDKRDGASTMAAQAERVVEQTLFSGDTLGMYKPGQFKNCKVINFNTTFDEIEMWWNKDIYLRPGFEAQGSTAVVPAIFRVIKGCYDNKIKYYEQIQRFCCGKTLLCKSLIDLGNLEHSGIYCNIHRGTDVNNTRFDAQRPFFENDKLVRDRIKNGRNYQYSFLDMNKQDMLLDKIEDLLTSNKVNRGKFRTEQEYIDTVLNIGLNLSDKILKLIQWFEFYTYNPNLVLILADQNMPNINNMILLSLLHELGFDILIFVPTGYSTIESLVGPELVYDTNIIGEANYDIDDAESLCVTNNIEIFHPLAGQKDKKPGFFSRLFGKG